MSKEPERDFVLTKLSSPTAGPFVLAAYLDLVARKLHDGRFDLKPDRHVLLLRQMVGHDWEIAGVGMFMVSAEMSVLWLDLLYVKEEFRGQGIARALDEQLRQLARDFACGTMQYGTSVKNTSMRSVAKRLGHTEEAIIVNVPLDT